ncbi:hypothetical protein A2707_02640 [Candidatus Saccharibacteria bacterium RIFCSPHIGHO2_01_FULL_45_15]|nr:MAG: hypothetical protein A2707_02640 [Candidatus Saccharibacteria bacterium RIFCSPHIGHO2_01_FULL_45_15]OGL27831.1 MAG: hypothetical protein A3C39_05005 [Candidatus Saccharibacteria bacterium RIFCSPHIGHO2_02_FULL_46_12]OGL31827.1 MAG: hypothetical protein A3E76_03235 [Candidatus Saccharibacteria bacterium RIFCSPHIGHO2_12_FULL_44_22]
MSSTHALRGVNFGGWLIVEKWLTPRLFTDETSIDEYGLSQSHQGRQKIVTHRDVFITESDFAWCRDHGIKLIRLPVGHWLFESDEGYVPQLKWVDWTFKMAKKYDLKVLVDLHAAKGSQNGAEHSGRVGAIRWSECQNDTIDLLCQIAKRYGKEQALWGIELLNEPDAKIGQAMLIAFYNRAYAALIPQLRRGTRVVFHDSFRPFMFSGTIQPIDGYPIVIDVHWYLFSFRFADILPLALLLGFVGMTYQLRVLRLRRRQPVIVGEWSSVLPQKLFDSVPRSHHNRLLSKSIDMQVKAFEHTNAYVYWNYKAEGRGMWNYRALQEDGVITLK